MVLRTEPWTTYGTCAYPECEAKYKNHSWGKIKAGDAGWFFQKNNDAWCPDHIPEWVTTWRERKKKQLSIKLGVTNDQNSSG